MLPKPGCGRAAGQDQVVTGIKLFCWSTWFWPICLGAGFPKDSSLAVNLKKSSVIFKIWDNARLKRCFISQQDSRPFHRLVYTVNLQERNVSDTTFHQLPSFTICLFIQSLNIYWEPSVVFKWGVCPNQMGAPKCGVMIRWKSAAWEVKGLIRFTWGRTEDRSLLNTPQGSSGPTARERLSDSRQWMRAVFILFYYYLFFIFWRGLFLKGADEEVWQCMEFSPFWQLCLV